MENNELAAVLGGELVENERILEIISLLKEKNYIDSFDFDLGKKMNLVSDVMYKIISEIRITKANNLGENLSKMLFLRNDILSASIKLQECIAYIREIAREIRCQKLAIGVASKDAVDNRNLPMRLEERNNQLTVSNQVLQQMYVICCVFAEKYNIQSSELEIAITKGAFKQQQRIIYGAKNIRKLMKDFADRLEDKQ